MNSSELAAAAQSATQISLDEAVTVKVRSYEVGQIVRIDERHGDSYIGEVTHVAGNLIVLADYSAWYDGDDAPYSSPYADDEVSVLVTNETTVIAL